MYSSSTKMSRADRLACEIMEYSRSSLLVYLRFLSIAITRLKLVPSDDLLLAMDGERIFFRPNYVFARYKAAPNGLCRDLLHIVLHCTFCHPFIGNVIDTDCWDLACDMAVEDIIASLELPVLNSAREKNQQRIIASLKESIKPFTAERIYRWLIDHPPDLGAMERMRLAFYTDDHALWYAWDGDEALDNDSSGENHGDADDSGRARAAEPADIEPSGGPERAILTKQGEVQGILGTIDEEDDDTSLQQGEGRFEPADADESSISSNPRTKGAELLSDMYTSVKQTLAKEWKSISERVQVDMETLSQQHGYKTASMLQSLREVTRERYDYSAFLRRFAVLGETMQLNDDEFDYIYYTYGLKLYKNMPLIEPLEHKEVMRIKEFVIAIDTSGSVSGNLVQMFVQKTYNILKQTESFFSSINLLIIQCDAEIQDVATIANQQEFDDYLASMTLKGFGGTDFRPVFRYVDKLISQGELAHLRGLIYFTDGYGTFPERRPNYETAFIFIEDEVILEPEVPVWAIKLVLKAEEI